MDTKIPSSFWSDRAVEATGPDIKLAALWLFSNSCMTVCGYAEVSEKRFAFETGLQPEVLNQALKALPQLFVQCEKGYWIPSFIREQFGAGAALGKSNMRWPIMRAVVKCPANVITLVSETYPELSGMISDLLSGRSSASDKGLTKGSSSSLDTSGIPSEALHKGLASPSQGLVEGSPRDTQAPERRGEERRGEEKRGTERRGDKGGVGETAPRRRAVKPGNVLPADLGAEGERMVAVGALLCRRPNTAWSPAELESFRGAFLDRLSAEDFESQLQPLRQFYGASIPREKDFRRRELLTLLNHWPGELDKARRWVRDNTDGGLTFGN